MYLSYMTVWLLGDYGLFLFIVNHSIKFNSKLSDILSVIILFSTEIPDAHRSYGIIGQRIPHRTTMPSCLCPCPGAGCPGTCCTVFNDMWTKNSTFTCAVSYATAKSLHIKIVFVMSTLLYEGSTKHAPDKYRF